MFVDMPLDQLREYLPARREPADFAEFWERTLTEARKHDLGAVFTEVETGLAEVRCSDATFAGYGGHPVRGWLLTPARETGPLPCVVQYIGYNGGRGFPHDWLLWPSAGWATFVMDSRGQGSGSRHGDTPDPAAAGNPPRRVGSPRASRRPTTTTTGGSTPTPCAPWRPPAPTLVDASRIVVSGGSQGGGIAMAVSALVPDLLHAFIDVPFMTHIRHATEITDSEPYAELARFFTAQRHRVEEVFATLDYFDGVNFAARSTTPALFSVALRDGITPPSTVFAAYNHYAGPKDIRVWPYNAHEGGGSAQVAEQLAVAAGLR
nr:cephalosporin-C deacetylase [Planobispora longispora]